MAGRPRGGAAAGHRTSQGSGISQFTRKRPLLIAVLGLAFGAVVGSFLRLTPEEKQVLGERVGRLKDQANRLKNSVSEVAMEGYVQAKLASEDTVEAASNVLKDSGKNQGARSVDQNPLVISDSAR